MLTMLLLFGIQMSDPVTTRAHIAGSIAPRVHAPVAIDQSGPQGSVQISAIPQQYVSFVPTMGWTVTHYGASGGNGRVAPSLGVSFYRAPSVQPCPAGLFVMVDLPGVRAHSFLLDWPSSWFGAETPPWNQNERWAKVGGHPFNLAADDPSAPPSRPIHQDVTDSTFKGKIYLWAEVWQGPVSLPGGVKANECWAGFTAGISVKGPLSFDPITGKRTASGDGGPKPLPHVPVGKGVKLPGGTPKPVPTPLPKLHGQPAPH